jgi:putative oxidoreductase
MRRYLPFNLNVAVLILRLALAAVLLYHGIPKLLHISDTVLAFQSMEAPVPAVTAGFAMIAEVVGGILFLFGFAVDVAGSLVAIDMLGAILLVHLPNGFDFTKGGWEHPFTVLCMAVAVALTGSGKYAVGWERKPYRGPERRRRD